MKLKEHIFGETVCKIKMSAHESDNYYNDKWLYLTAGICGDEPEAIFVVEQLKLWIERDFFHQIPLIILPIINYDGYYINAKLNAQGLNLNHSFPRSVLRRAQGMDTRGVPSADANRVPEVFFLKKLMQKQLPGLVVNFRTSPKPKIIINAEEGANVGRYFSLLTRYQMIHDNKSPPGSLEAFVNDYLLCPSVTIKLPIGTPSLSFKNIWNEIKLPLTQLLSGQIY